MLQTLTIHNLALIEKLVLEFEPDFTTLTGETGAGKSILLDALGLALGNRADSGLVRYGTAKADVIAQFEIAQLPHIQAWLKEQSLEDEADESTCFLRRVVTAEGRSKAYINGIPATVSQLKMLGALLIDIHGQHEHQRLVSSQNQLQLLDDYAQHPNLTQKCAKNYQAWAILNEKLQNLRSAQFDRQSKIELLSFQQSEFETVKPIKGEFETLSEQQQSLSHANEIQTGCVQAYDFIEGDLGASQQVIQAINTLEPLVEYQPNLQACLTQLNSHLIDLQEVAADIHAQSQDIENDPQQLQQLENRLSELFGLAKKYQIVPEELPQKYQQIQEELAQIQQASESLETLQAEIDQAWAELTESAKKLTLSRQKSAKKLSKIVMESMRTLGMAQGVFEIRLSNSPTPNAFGQDKVEFLVTANKGQPLQPLSKVASGGELSRISLAIQVASAEVASLPTLIFDEVDVGIGGGIAEIVGQKMKTLGRHRQILSITHLPQVAVYGKQHLNIQKQTQNEQTFTQVTPLKEPQRIEEIARMLGGVNMTQQTLKHAQEMLELAQKF